MYENSYNEVGYESRFIGKTFLYMAIALMVTFVVAYAVSQDYTMFYLVYRYNAIPFVLLGIEILLVSMITRNVHKYSKTKLLTLFFVYSVINALTFSAIFVRYQLGFIFSVFLVASGMFFCSAMIGITIKRDLSIVGRIAIMGVIGLIIVGVLSMFFPAIAGNPVYNLLGVIIFSALTAYDMQKVKRYAYEAGSYGAVAEKFQIVAALTLYLDFINLFIYLLRLLGRKK